MFQDWQRTQTQSSVKALCGARDSEWMSGSAKAGTTAERHRCELRVLAGSVVRAPPKRASGDLCFLLTRDLHGGRLVGHYRAMCQNASPRPRERNRHRAPATTCGRGSRQAFSLRLAFFPACQELNKSGQGVLGVPHLCVIAFGLFGTSGSGAPASRFSTRFARKSVNGAMSSPTLAFSSAAIYAFRSPTGITVHG